MKYGISGAPVESTLPYAEPINIAAIEADSFPCLAYAIAERETIRGEINGTWCAATVESFDGGHGLFQLTSSWPVNWRDPQANASYAVSQFIQPAIQSGIQLGLESESLVKFVAAAFNEGLGAAEKYHAQGNVDLGTTGNNYGADVLVNYLRLVQGKNPD